MEYDAITPEQWIYGLAGIFMVFGVMAWLFFRYARPRPERITMSSDAPAPVHRSVPDPVHVPVRDTGTEAASIAPREVVPADTTAVNAGTDYQAPRVSRSMTDRDIIVTLAVQRTANKYRLSANQIATLMGGSRAEVLAIVKEVRDPAPTFRPLTPEQQAMREQLGLASSPALDQPA